ncbi:S-adenosylmethionine-dependent methyltransferase [Propionigenium maris DSM 9537]|uniref:S-adenosylmethionine-dependent methyltransferase n=1 Tax=Propionigenium maris DSM 9537 TaxID=1123000 RepID=A0A9W6GNV2_9FUSO|nr:class I SAM-dependent methyltransferase [Propionigenium maris]GLI56982.1 S-adenosylmethionine-dependent methyltransferase [Propionigenium maris DSM 9537]
MVESKEWNWAEVTLDIWNIPSEDVYYYLHRWSSLNFSTFLDMGCGLGRHSLLFAANGYKTYGMDLSEYALSKLREGAKEKGVAVETQVGDINKLPYEREKFDCLLAYHVISHTDTDGIKNIVGEIRRVLKTGGEFFVTLCSKRSPSYTKESNIIVDSNTIIKMEEPEVGIPHYYCELEDVKRLMADFEVIRIRHIGDIYEDTSSWHYFVHGRKKD